MLLVGLTGGLGSGKSTAAWLFEVLGAVVLQSDAIARELMEPGQAVYAQIVDHFGKDVVRPDGRLDRAALAKIAFADGRVEELNAIVHPAVIARQVEQSEEVFQADRRAVVIVESALIFETRYGETGYATHATGGPAWKNRFDRIILVTAPDEVKIARYVARCASGEPLTPERQAMLEAEARQRLAQQIPDEEKIPLCDYVLTNGGSRQELERQVSQLWPTLKAAAE